MSDVLDTIDIITNNVRLNGDDAHVTCYIGGGYIRDKLLEEDYSDIDLIICMDDSFSKEADIKGVCRSLNSLLPNYTTLDLSPISEEYKGSDVAVIRLHPKIDWGRSLPVSDTTEIDVVFYNGTIDEWLDQVPVSISKVAYDLDNQTLLCKQSFIDGLNEGVMYHDRLIDINVSKYVSKVGHKYSHRYPCKFKDKNNESDKTVYNFTLPEREDN